MKLDKATLVFKIGGKLKKRGGREQSPADCLIEQELEGGGI